MLERMIKESNLPIVMYHLRHTFATRAIKRAITLPQLKAILGHANLR